MQSEGELRFCIFLYQIFVNLNFRFGDGYCNSIEEYDPQTNKWREVGEFNLQFGGDNSFNNSHKTLFYRKKLC